MKGFLNMDDEIKKNFFEEEYERERARDVFKSVKEVKATSTKRKLQYIYDVIITGMIIYFISLLKDLFGFSNIVIFDTEFLIPLFLIAVITGLGFIIFPKSQK